MIEKNKIRYAPIYTKEHVKKTVLGITKYMKGSKNITEVIDIKNILKDT